MLKNKPGFLITRSSIHLGLIFLLTIIFFKNAFQVLFFKDDFFFLNVSRINLPSDFLKFFWPVKNYFYRPLPTEVFYLLVNTFQLNEIIRHCLVFAFYLTGLFFLYQIMRLLFKKPLFAFIVTLLYGLNFTHVFQLYWLSTFQEIALFACLTSSFYFFLINKQKASLMLFIAAAMSKETAVIFPLFLLIYLATIKKKTNVRYLFKTLLPFLAIAVFFLLIFKFGVKNVTDIEIYKLQFKPKLIINNWLWYFFWSLGAANFFPEYFVSVLKPPLPDFYKAFLSADALNYGRFLFAYWSIFLLTAVVYFLEHRPKFWPALKNWFLCLLFFTIFIGPTLPIVHRWMVRLTIPLIFVIYFQAYLLNLFLNSSRGVTKLSGILIIVLYLIWNIYGIKLHEASSSYFLESRFVNNTLRFFNKNKMLIASHKYVYFADPPPNDTNPWGGSEKLKVTYWGQNFFQYYFVGKNIIAVYGYETKKIPKNAYIIKSIDLLTKNE